MTQVQHAFRYDVALSFAGEDRPYVATVAKQLHARGVEVFYDEFATVETWGTELPVYFDDVFRKHARYTVVFVSEHYARKPWTRHEHRSALARAVFENSAYLLPVRLDDTELEGLRPSVAYIDGRVTSPHDLADLIERKLRGAPPPATEPLQEIVRTPRTAADQQRLLRERPPAWEYLLYASELLRRRDELEPAYRDHMMRYRRHDGAVLSDEAAVEYLLDQFDAVSLIISNIGRVLAPEAQEAAFGRPGEPGDPANITHLADRLVRIYSDLLEWAARLRASRPPEDLATAFDLASRLGDLSIVRIRGFIDEFARSVDHAVACLSDDSDEAQTVLTMRLDLDVDQHLMRQFTQELKRLKRLKRRRR